MDSSPSGISSGEQTTHHQKRSRVLLSCAPCRNSKLKCDRDQPCSQCMKKGRTDQCVYAPKPEKKRPAKGMSARLKRLEGMVREMMEAEAGEKKDDRAAAGPVVAGQVVTGENATTYVGATHCMAMLEDIEDLKSYFDHPEDLDDGEFPTDELDSAELILGARRGPRNRGDLLSHMPDRKVCDRLITRYFASMSPSQHIVHRATFTRAYSKFWQDPSQVSLHWVAQLFMMLALGVFFNNFVNPSEVEGDSPVPAEDRIRDYKSCAGWALVWGKYTQPTTATLPAFLLYVESHFLFNRAAQMNCYILSGICLRLMMKMGLHRDPSQLANITPFEGEMRRRMWNMAVQVELLVSFHMGLPSMMQGIETDTAVPRNLQDEDFDEDSVDLPPGRPASDYTAMTYPIYKTHILRVFGQIARQAHALAPPSYNEVLKIDNQLQETWNSIPSFMKVRPLDECVGDPPPQLIQRFGIGSLYNKCRCVLHRRYLAEAIPKPEHDYSRKQCLEGALSLLNYQYIIWEACKPGHVLSQNGWFVSSLAVHDFLLAAMIIYLVIQNENYSNFESEYDWMSQQSSTPTKAELVDIIKRSHFIWSEIAQDVTEVKKTADTLAIMLAKLGHPVGSPPGMPGISLYPPTVSLENESPSLGAPSMDPSTVGAFGSDPDLFPNLGLSGSGTASGPEQAPFPMGAPADAVTGMSYPGIEATTTAMPDIQFDPSWIQTPADMDWRYFDISLSNSQEAGRNGDPDQTWMEPPSLDTMMESAGWQAPTGGSR